MIEVFAFDCIDRTFWAYSLEMIRQEYAFRVQWVNDNFNFTNSESMSGVYKVFLNQLTECDQYVG